MLQEGPLTEEQRAVVQHETGPAVVRAVPGAGKTTALVHRIRFLVDECGVSPGHILASSFGRATVQDLEAGLEVLGVHCVDTRTLHALGLSLLRRTDAASTDESAPDPGPAARILARRAVSDLATDRDLDREELGLSVQDLVDQVAAWKQQLAYPNSELANLSDPVREHARTATHENEDFLTLYERFEAHRQEEGWLTYPDMLRDGWVTLLHDEALRSELRDNYRHVLVDEFQDVSRVQFHLLNLLTSPVQGTGGDGSYMVIGDADQCIYGWRGADPSFLTDFVGRYDADEYLLTDSFRLPAAPLVLANAVIDKNESRPPKRLHLTQGVDGTTRLLNADTPAHAADHIADTAETLRETGYALDDVAVLVRTYGQTPPIEQAMIDRGLPYRLRGRPPFYRRRAVQTLLRYLYWAVLERRLRRDGWFGDAKTARRYTDRFAHVLKTPTRYVQHGRIDRITQEARTQNVSVLDVLADHRSAMPDGTAERVDHFLEVAEALVDRLDAPPPDTLDWLMDAIDYEAALRERSAVPERGDARVRTARALVDYAKGYDSTSALLRGIRSLAAEQERLDTDDSAIDLRSIHRAKGAEWPVVIVPGCTEGTLPLDGGAQRERDLEEERRLFYVALTRPLDQLVLVTDGSGAPSRFLDEAEVDTRLDAVRQVRRALSGDRASLSDRDLGRLCQNLTELGLARYVRRWWAPSEEQNEELRERLDALAPAVARATRRRNAYRQARAEHEAQTRRAQAEATKRIDDLKSVLGTAPLTATNEQPDTYYPDDASFSLGWVDDASQIGIYWSGTRAGTLDPFGPHRLDASTLLDLPWDAMMGRFEGVAQGRSRLRFTIDWVETERMLTAQAKKQLSPPDPPTEKTRLLTSESFRRGYDLLRDTLHSPAVQVD